jgi:hypothetical protein
MNDDRRSLHFEDRDRRPDDLDTLLRRLFRAAMPKDWPAPPRLPEAPRPRPRPWYRQPSRLALAAAVAFFLLGYLALASLFPKGAPSGGVSIKPEIGLRDRLPKVVPPGRTELRPGVELIQPEIVPTPRGNQAEISGHRTQGPRPTIYLHLKMVK